ncbi:Domain amino terminal to FKBP-type peptidyl-prolyl isomerase [Pedobacter westerhofensis]|uniref:peptidylprolyl isomerase n=1 Tax=Pedobacter westerhofensis TaxID=425512 RepID=A0A521FRL6_9SPHI|nr:aspartyl protease family protein [Pedobacter westerhofensis]SMO98863.1 Domain amino terminal to FKBP-type peptidyl-prolyl isomerase [Pedobacter westerhofensis]
MRFRNILLAATLVLGSIHTIYAQVAELPFEFRGKHLFVKAQTGTSDTLNFIFDTGATGAMIDSATAERAGISKESRLPASVAGSGGSQSYIMALNQSIKVGNTEFKHINLTMVNFASLSSGLGTKLDGIIGYEVMNRYITKIDFDRKKISLYDQNQPADTTGYTAIPFEFNKSVMIPRFPISITLANGETFNGKVMFDTGNAFPLLISTPFSKFHNFDSKLGETSRTIGRGMNAVTQDQVADIKSMSFNGFNFGPMSVRLTLNEKAEAKDGYLGILGIEIIKRFNVIMDYGRKRIYLKPNDSFGNVFEREMEKKRFKAENAAFLMKNKLKPGIKTTSSGLQYRIIKTGKGSVPKLSDRVSLHFKTTLINGKKLWSTYDDGKPWVHHLDKALEGVKEAALLMPAGSKWVVYIPSDLACGDDGDEDVPGGATLIYEMEVLKAEKD